MTRISHCEKWPDKIKQEECITYSIAHSIVHWAHCVKAVKHDYNHTLFRMLFSQAAVSHCSTSNVNSPNWSGKKLNSKKPVWWCPKIEKEHGAFKQTVFLKREKKVPALSRYK